MIKHIVIWKFKESAEGLSKDENIAIVTERLYSLVGVIDEIKKMEIGSDISHTDMSGDMVLLTEFDNVEDMKKYAVDPRHVQVAAYVRKVVLSRTVIDYEF